MVSWFACFSSGHDAMAVTKVEQLSVATSAIGLAPDPPRAEDTAQAMATIAIGFAPDLPRAENTAQAMTVRESEPVSSHTAIPFPPSFYEKAASGSMRNSSRDIGSHSLPRPASLDQADDTASKPPEQREFKDSQDLERALHVVFLQFARFGSRSDAQHLDSFRFMKLCRECCLTTDLGETQCVDLIFYQENSGSSGHLCAVFQQCPSHPLGAQAQLVRDEKGKREAFKLYSKCTAVNNKHKMSFSKFKLALRSIAELLGVELVDVKKAIASSSGPLVHNVTLPAYQHIPERQVSSRLPTFASGPIGKVASLDSHCEDLCDEEFDTMACMPPGPAFKVLAPGTYPTGIISASVGSSSGFVPDVHPRVGSPRSPTGRLTLSRGGT